jgi:hypothetical protein
MNRTVVRNVAIIAAIAALAVVWSTGFSAIAEGISQIILVIFVFALLGFGYQYFRRNELAWSVISENRRRAIIGSAIGIAVLIVIGFPLLSPVIGPLGVIALIAILASVIAWIIYDSRRFNY